MRFERFTIRGQEAVQEAIAVAERGQNQQVEPEHLLAAMLEQKEGLLKPILGKIGANAQAILTETQAVIAKFPKVSGGQQYFSSRTNTIFQDAQKIAETMEDEYLSTEHLLLAISSEKQGDAGQDQAQFQVIRLFRVRHGYHLTFTGRRLAPPSVLLTCLNYLNYLTTQLITSPAAGSRRCGMAPGLARSTRGLQRHPKAWPQLLRRHGWSGSRRRTGSTLATGQNRRRRSLPPR